MKMYFFKVASFAVIMILHGTSLRAETTLTDGAQDFASSQGDSGWSYGSGYGSSFETEGWSYEPNRWLCDKGPAIGVGIIGNYPLPNDTLASYTQPFWNSRETVTRAWRSKRNLQSADISVRFFFGSQGGDGTLLRIFRDNEELTTVSIANDVEPFKWRDVVNLKTPIKAGDTIYFALSSGEHNNSDYDNCAFVVAINSD